ncbi:MAG TPA: hypothetical protein V6C72_02160, partial [Chroococcales cyanobacterium]
GFVKIRFNAGWLIYISCLVSFVAASAWADEGASYDKSGFGSYPRVTELEQQFLGKTYLSDPLDARVKRLEIAKFGKVAAGDLCDRIDKLDQLAAPKSPPPDSESADAGDDSPSVANNGQSASTEPSTDGQQQYAPSDYGDYPRVTALEKAVLGKGYDGEALQVRLARLETKEYNKTFPQDALADRIDRLTAKIDPKDAYNPNEDVDGQEAAAAADGGQKRGGIGGTIGRSVLNMFGGNMMTGFGTGVGPGLPTRYANPQRGQTQEVQKPVRENPFLAGSSSAAGAENRTAVMERFVFGKDSSTVPLLSRVQRLEKKLVPYEHHDGDSDLEKRVNHLWSILQAANGPAMREAQ